MRTRTSFSLWLMPTGEVYLALANLISDLSKKYSSPRFAPHVTLLGELNGSHEEIESRASRLSVNLRPHVIKLSKVEYLDEYFRSLFVRVEETEEVLQANLRARDIFSRRNDAKYFPHLSIMYGNFPSATKDEIIRKIGREFTLEFEVSSLHLVDTSSRPEDWFTAREFAFGSTG
jgi:2'-5' RNA ligase